MTYFAQQGDFEVSRLHNAAIRKEISERLAIAIKPKLSVMPPQLMMLMRQMHDEPLSPLPA